MLKKLHVAYKYLYHLNVIVCIKIEKIKKMKTTKLGKTSLDIPAIALGVMRMGLELQNKELLQLTQLIKLV